MSKIYPTPREALGIVSKAWGRQSGWCFFPSISGRARDKAERRSSYDEGPAFLWPRDKDKIIAHLERHAEDDIYWCPSLFERKQRKMEWAMDEGALWADLDEVDPEDIHDVKPTIAWETSPGRYQALWIIQGGLMGASWEGNENQRLTYMLGADASGWDTTQLLRLPGWANHKPDHELPEDYRGKLLWRNGPRYLPTDFADLPEVQRVGAQVDEIFEAEIDAVDRHAVLARVRLKLPHKAREFLKAKEVSGDRSERLWWLMRCFADVGCTPLEIVAVLRSTAWNKFAGRNDELKRLTIEAHKAVHQRSDEAKATLEHEEQEKPEPAPLWDILARAKPPRWLIRNLWTETGCGFIGGQPKSYKSWIGLDMALSVATGVPFLDHFPIVRPGPVFYIQEEDADSLVKQRTSRIWPQKQGDHVELDDRGDVVWTPADPQAMPKIMGYIGNSVTISDPAWQEWLDEKLAVGWLGEEPYRLLLMDPLMMLAGFVDEHRANEMTEHIFKPLKLLSRKHKIAIAVVHHMRKGRDGDKDQRGGQLMLGSMANHAWAEDSIYVTLERGGTLAVERESKHGMSGTFRLANVRERGWRPSVESDEDTRDADQVGARINGGSSPKKRGTPRDKARTKRLGVVNYNILSAMEEVEAQQNGLARTSQVAEVTGISTSNVGHRLANLENWALIRKSSRGRWTLTTEGRRWLSEGKLDGRRYILK